MLTFSPCRAFFNRSKALSLFELNFFPRERIASVSTHIKQKKRRNTVKSDCSFNV